MKTLLKAVAEEFKVGELDLTGESQEREFCDARKAFFYFLKDVMDLHWWQITNLTGKKIATIDYNRKKCKELYDTDHKFRKKIDNLMMLYMDNQIELP